MNYEMPTHSPPVILKYRAMKRGTGGGWTLPADPSPRPEAGRKETASGKPPAPRVGASVGGK